MRNHPLHTVHILESLKESIYCDDIQRSIINEMRLYHHEKYDGTGYPTGKRMDFIPIVAQICAIANSFDEIVSERCYKDKQTLPQMHSTITFVYRK